MPGKNTTEKNATRKNSTGKSGALKRKNCKTLLREKAASASGQLKISNIFSIPCAPLISEVVSENLENGDSSNENGSFFVENLAELSETNISHFVEGI